MAMSHKDRGLFRSPQRCYTEQYSTVPQSVFHMQGCRYQSPGSGNRLGIEIPKKKGLITNMRDAAMPAPNRRFQRLNNQDWYMSTGTRSVPKTKSSSKTKGIARANAKGHPTMAPVAKHIVAMSVRRLFRKFAGSIAYEKANMLRYIANEEGRSAAGCRQGFTSVKYNL